MSGSNDGRASCVSFCVDTSLLSNGIVVVFDYRSFTFTVRQH